MQIGNDWWTAPAEGENGRLVLVTGRRGLEAVRATGVYRYRVEVTWRYAGDSRGLPEEADATVMEEVTDALNACLDKDPVAVMTGIYTGDDERNWVFYTRSLHIFQRKFNEALAGIDRVLPLEFAADEDAEWEEYRQMCETEVAQGEE